MVGFLTPEPINEAFYVLVMCAAFMAVAMCRYLLSLVVALEKRVEELEKQVEDLEKWKKKRPALF